MQAQASATDWRFAEFMFMSTLGVFSFAFSHLAFCHWIVSNSLVTAIRENLSPQHPVRRVMYPFVHRAIMINHAAITRVSKHHAPIIDAVQVPQAEDLKTAGIRQDWTLPTHELVKSPRPCDHLLSWLQMEVIRVGEHHFGTGAQQLFRADAFHGGQGAHGHETRCVNRSMRGLKTAATSCTAGAVRADFKAEHG